MVGVGGGLRYMGARLLHCCPPPCPMLAPTCHPSPWLPLPYGAVTVLPMVCVCLVRLVLCCRSLVGCGDIIRVRCRTPYDPALCPLLCSLLLSFESVDVLGFYLFGVLRIAPSPPLSIRGGLWHFRFSLRNTSPQFPRCFCLLLG